MENYFKLLNNVNVNENTEQKNGLTYLSWAWAWAEVKKLFPDANYTIYENEVNGFKINYFTDGRTCWVKTGVIINGIEHIEELPVMDYKNKSISYEAITSTDVNKAIQRSLTKACARHGLGLYIYAGEDLPEEEKKEQEQTKVLEKQKLKTELLAKASEVGVNLEELAKYFTTTVEKLSADQLQFAINSKSKKLEQAEVKNPTSFNGE